MKHRAPLALITLLTAIASPAHGGLLSYNGYTMHKHRQTTLSASTDPTRVETRDSDLTLSVNPLWQVTRPRSGDLPPVPAPTSCPTRPLSRFLGHSRPGCVSKTLAPIPWKPLVTPSCFFILAVHTCNLTEPPLTLP